MRLALFDSHWRMKLKVVVAWLLVLEPIGYYNEVNCHHNDYSAHIPTITFNTFVLLASFIFFLDDFLNCCGSGNHRGGAYRRPQADDEQENILHQGGGAALV